jgi:hypothetical protein
MVNRGWGINKEDTPAGVSRPAAGWVSKLFLLVEIYKTVFITFDPKFYE